MALNGGAEACVTRIPAYLHGLAIELMVASEAVDVNHRTGWVEAFLNQEGG